MNYTPGEWKTYKNALGTWAVSTDIEPIAQVDRHYNAHLITAAPEMYEALKNLVERRDEGLALGEALDVTLARQALAKAEGGKR